MVRLYPALQADVVDGLTPNHIERATLAHLYFLIFSVLDDRRRDGQVELTHAELEFTVWHFERGLEILGEFVPESELKRLAVLVLERYERSHEKLNRENECTRGFSEETCDIVVGRSYWGALATLALLHAHPEAQANVINAFEPLVWGIQWVDDVEDWREDIVTGDDNLMMLTIAASIPRTLEKPSEVCQRVIAAKAILARDAIPRAIAQARAAFEIAADVQTRLGCTALAQLIRERADSLAPIESNAVRQCKADALIGDLARVAAAQAAKM
jgi:hypothetical protein